MNREWINQGAIIFRVTDSRVVLAKMPTRVTVGFAVSPWINSVTKDDFEGAESENKMEGKGKSAPKEKNQKSLDEMEDLGDY